VPSPPGSTSRAQGRASPPPVPSPPRSTLRAQGRASPPPVPSPPRSTPRAHGSASPPPPRSPPSQTPRAHRRGSPPATPESESFYDSASSSFSSPADTSPNTSSMTPIPESSIISLSDSLFNLSLSTNPEPTRLSAFPPLSQNLSQQSFSLSDSILNSTDFPSLAYPPPPTRRSTRTNNNNPFQSARRSARNK